MYFRVCNLSAAFEIFIKGKNKKSPVNCVNGRL
jgi:hypothetical protein